MQIVHVIIPQLWERVPIRTAFGVGEKMPRRGVRRRMPRPTAGRMGGFPQLWIYRTAICIQPGKLWFIKRLLEKLIVSQ